MSRNRFRVQSENFRVDPNTGIPIFAQGFVSYFEIFGFVHRLAFKDLKGHPKTESWYHGGHGASGAPCTEALTLYWAPCAKRDGSFFGMDEAFVS